LQWNGNGRVLRYQLDGTYLGEFTSVGVSQSIGLDWDSSGNLYVSSYNGDHVRKYDSNGNDQGLFINTNLVGPTNVTFVDNGDLLVSDYDGAKIRRMYDSEGNFIKNFVSSGSGGLNTPNAVVIRNDNTGDVFQINAGLNDAWYNPETDGQGFPSIEKQGSIPIQRVAGDNIALCEILKDE